MKGVAGRRNVRWGVAIGVVVLALACTSSPGQGESATLPASEQPATAGPTIRPVMPARDSVGRAPVRFEWTPVEGADRYAIDLWNEVDRLLWRQDDIHDPSIATPDEVDLVPGTYFWRISAIGHDRQLADSGWSAFVVRD